MRYDAEHKAATHRRIIKSASRQLRKKGLNGPAVATLMEASGLTHGGFYKHFSSRDDLVVEAVEESLRELTQTLIDAARNTRAHETVESHGNHLSLARTLRPARHRMPDRGIGSGHCPYPSGNETAHFCGNHEIPRGAYSVHAGTNCGGKEFKLSGDHHFHGRNYRHRSNNAGISCAAKDSRYSPRSAARKLLGGKRGRPISRCFCERRADCRMKPPEGALRIRSKGAARVGSQIRIAVLTGIRVR